MKRFNAFKAMSSMAILSLLLLACTTTPIRSTEFLSATGDEQYVLGPEDVIEVSVWKEQELSKVVTVRPDGMISLPLIGDIQATDLTTEELGDTIANALVDFVDSPTVSVIVQQINSLKIFIQGEVVRPGVFELKSNTTLLQLISLAGGFTEWAKKDKLFILRKSGEGEVTIPINYEKILSGKDLGQNILLKRGDTIVVP